MRLHPDIVQPHHQIFADPVVQHALAGNDALLGAIAGGRVVLEILHQGAGLRPLEQDFGFALIELAAAGHGRGPYIKRRLGQGPGGLRQGRAIAA
jgi:hypothetical protein